MQFSDSGHFGPEFEQDQWQYRTNEFAEVINLDSQNDGENPVFCEQKNSEPILDLEAYLGPDYENNEDTTRNCEYSEHQKSFEASFNKVASPMKFSSEKTVNTRRTSENCEMLERTNVQNSQYSHNQPRFSSSRWTKYVETDSEVKHSKVQYRSRLQAQGRHNRNLLTNSVESSLPEVEITSFREMKPEVTSFGQKGSEVMSFCQTQPEVTSFHQADEPVITSSNVPEMRNSLPGFKPPTIGGTSNGFKPPTINGGANIDTGTVSMAGQSRNTQV